MLNKLHEWSYKWQISSNVSKCCILSIRRKRTPPELNYTLGNTFLNVVNSHSYLRVVPDTKATAYISLVRPHLEYAEAAWDAYLVGVCKQLEKVQHRAARFVKRDYRSTTLVSSLISQPGCQTLSDRRKKNIAYRSCARVFTVWLVFPPHLFVVLPSPPIQLMATHFVSHLLEPILTSTSSILVPLLIGMPSRHL